MGAMRNFLVLVVIGAMLVGCQDRRQRRIQNVQQDIDDSKTKTDNLREALRYLSQMTPLNRVQMTKEIQPQLNTWTQSADTSSLKFQPCSLIEGLPAQLIAPTSLDHLELKQFGYADVEYMFQCRLMRMLSDWIVERPLKDSLLTPFLDKQKKIRPEGEFSQLEQACKLFDWSVRNVMLLGDAKEIERLEDDPQMPLMDVNYGYGYLPWQTVLFSRGDFVERGRAFAAMARQRNIPTIWIGLKRDVGTATKLWCMGVLVGNDCYLFDPKLGLPIIDPDTREIATLDQAMKNERILRRLSLPGRFTYAVTLGDLKQPQFLIDAEASSLTAKMQLLESRLLADERVRLTDNPDELAQKLKQRYPDVPVSLWQTPLLARLYSEQLAERLQMIGPFTAQYMQDHAVWMADTPAAQARWKHLRGEFENTLETKGALAVYMSFRIDDERLRELTVDVELQKELGVTRRPNEPQEIFDARLMQAAAFFGEAKLDANFMLGQLQFDLGNYESTEGWLKKRTVEDPRAARWFSAAWYTLARTYQQQGKSSQMMEALAHEPNSMEAGNRLRLRYLTPEEK